MRRGDLITVALPGDFGKPRPAVVLQSDDYAGAPTVLICPLTTALRDAPAFRFTIEPEPSNGLRSPSQAMLDKLSPHLRTKCGPTIGRLTERQMNEITMRVLALLGAG